MSIKSILVATDLSSREHAAIQRAWQLADAHHATVTLMYMAPRDQPVPSNAALRLESVARQLEESLGLRVKTVSVQASKPEHLAAEGSGIDLIVLPHRSERSTAAFFRGHPVLRVLRRCSTPVLVTRQSGGAHYRHILVAVDFSPESEALVKLAAELNSRADLEIFHAVDTRNEARLRSAEATDQAILAYRQRCLKHAHELMLTLSNAFDSRGNRFLTTIGGGDPGTQTVLQQEHSNADLVVVGKKPTSVWEDFVCASVAHRVLSWASSDVLVVPRAYAQATAPIAAHRMQADEGRRALTVQPTGRRAS